MPQYCFTDSTGCTIQKVFRMGKAPKTVNTNGRTFYRDIPAEHRSFRDTPGNWPKKCDATGVHPDQIEDAYALSRAQGCPTEFTSDGRRIFTNAQHRKRWCELSGYYDRNGGYSDPQRR